MCAWRDGESELFGASSLEDSNPIRSVPFYYLSSVLSFFVPLFLFPYLLFVHSNIFIIYFNLSFGFLVGPLYIIYLSSLKIII